MLDARSCLEVEPTQWEAVPEIPAVLFPDVRRATESPHSSPVQSEVRMADALAPWGSGRFQPSTLQQAHV